MRRVVTVLVLALAACGSSERAPAALPAAEAADLLINRNWIDRWPQHEAERLHVYRFTPAMGGGVYQDRTLYAGSFELFTYDVADGRIAFDLPHRNDRVRARFRIEQVAGPAPFDLRLTLDPSPRGPAVYYGRSAESAAESAQFAPLR